jgi:hypothetical protein
MSLKALKIAPIPSDLMKTLVYVDFGVLKENWNRYKLEDESMLKTKLVLINVMLEKNYGDIMERAKTEKGLKIGMAFQSQIVVGVQVPPDLRGEPDANVHSIDELRSSIVEEDLDFEALAETSNVYKLPNGIIIKFRNRPVTVSRTSKFDRHGLPMYLVDSAADMSFRLPK